jgi:hypothetical protein
MDLHFEVMARKDDYFVSCQAGFRGQPIPDVLHQLKELLKQLEVAGFAPVKAG